MGLQSRPTPDKFVGFLITHIIYQVQHKDALQTKSFKTSFMNFLDVEWNSSNYINIIDGHSLYYAFEKKCQQYQITDGILDTKLISELECCHQEADTCLVYHAHHVACKTQEPTILIVQIDDTNNFVFFFPVSYHQYISTPCQVLY